MNPEVLDALADAQRALERLELALGKVNGSPLMRDVVVSVCREFDIDMGELKGPGRTRYLAEARRVAYFAARKLCPNRSIADIAAYLNREDSTFRSRNVTKPLSPHARAALMNICAELAVTP